MDWWSSHSILMKWSLTSDLKDAFHRAMQVSLHFFWWNRGIPYWLYNKRSKSSKVQHKKSLRNKERNKEGQKNYKVECNLWCMGSFLCSFALRITRANSILNLCRTEFKLGWKFVKIRSFLSIPMHQLMIMMISMKKFELSCSRKHSKTSKGSPVGKTRWKISQQSTAKGHRRNRCSTVSRSGCWQRTQS